MAKGHLDELQKAYIVSTSKLVPSVIIKTYYIVLNKSQVMNFIIEVVVTGFTVLTRGREVTEESVSMLLVGSSSHSDDVPYDIKLTHCGLVTPYGDINLGQYWYRQ